MAKSIHYLIDDESACGREWDGESENFSEELDETTCKKCLASDEYQEALEEYQADQEELAKEDNEEDEEEEELPAPPVARKAIFTLAPKAIDKADSQEVPCVWLYQGHALRKVLTPVESVQNQINAYLHPIPYLTFQEQTLEKYIKQGRVTEAAENGMACDPIKASIKVSNNIQEETSMPAKKQAIVTPQVPAMPGTAPLGLAPKPSALDAILAAPIAPMPLPETVPARVHIMKHAPVGVPVEMLKKHLPLPEERSEQAIVAGIELGTMPHDIYRAFVKAFKQALKEEGLVIVPAAALVPIEPGCGEESAPAPVPGDPIGDAWSDMLPVEQAMPAKPKSTLQVFTGGKKPQTPARDIPGNNGKVPVDTIKAIQRAWKNKTMTQAELAAKYGINDKAIWYYCNRAKSLI